MRRGRELLASMGRRLMSAPVVATLGRDLLDDIREDWIYNGEDWTRPGFRALVMYRFGARLSKVSSGVLRLPLKLVYRFLHRRVRNHYGIELHHTAKIGQRVVLAGQAAIAIHELAEIGNECIINQGVTIGADAESLTDDAPKLGKGVTLGVGAVVVGSVRIGDGAKIGPNAVVTMDVPAGSLAIAPRAQVIQPGGHAHPLQLQDGALARRTRQLFWSTRQEPDGPLHGWGSHRVFAAAVSPAKSRRLLPFLGGLDGVFANRAEATALTGRPINGKGDALAAAQALCDLGAEQAFVTMGEAGAVAAEGGAGKVWPAPPAEVCDVNGAGDGFAAGVVEALSRGADMDDAMAQGLSTFAIHFPRRRFSTARSTWIPLSSCWG